MCAGAQVARREMGWVELASAAQPPPVATPHARATTRNLPRAPGWAPAPAGAARWTCPAGPPAPPASGQTRSGRRLGPAGCMGVGCVWGRHWGPLSKLGYVAVNLQKDGPATTTQCSSSWQRGWEYLLAQPPVLHKKSKCAVRQGAIPHQCHRVPASYSLFAGSDVAEHNGAPAGIVTIPGPAQSRLGGEPLMHTEGTVEVQVGTMVFNVHHIRVANSQSTLHLATCDADDNPHQPERTRERGKQDKHC